ncbi:hypothetical protein [Flavimarina sp. Hel_I_48]|uniref:hypothetical protein n=1 Tax=Flavimarina sp. Hel_I_48 TaxID=1392488 RepID=UPI0004DF0654|nr:hypothetical protein [Flavimarina sp. Hel_I_48]
MLRYFLIFVLFAFVSCNDGDVIVTNFDFEGLDINLCRTAQVNQPENIKYVFSKINPDTQEALVLEFITSEPILSKTTDGKPYEIKFNGTTAKVNYRIFNAEVTEDYFCSAIPPASPIVNEEYISGEGTALITVTGIRMDDDGVPSEVERGLGNEDIDGDGIPNEYDFDDDGDNIPTKSEGIALDADGNFDMLACDDTDKDGIPDFMDPDDDGDKTDTRDEDKDMDLNPNNDRSDPAVSEPDYLNPDYFTDYDVNEYIVHSYSLTDIRVTIVLNDLVFRNTATDEIIRREELLYETFNAENQNITVTPVFSQE